MNEATRRTEHQVPRAAGQPIDRGAPPRGRIRVLFVCTGNSARSLMAEAVLRQLGGGRFATFSAGTFPRGVHPLTTRALAEGGISAAGLRSKPVTEVLDERFDWVITVCDRAREACPVFPGAERALHWGFDDPAETEGTEEQRLATFRRILGEITLRTRAFIPLAERQLTPPARRAGS